MVSRSLPTRSLRRIEIGTAIIENSARRQSSRNMAMVVITTMLKLRANSLAVWVTSVCRPPISLAIRDWISPERVAVKNDSESDCRCE
ncbi:hypothetical protein D3C79_972870 [compost metagenome]